MLIRRVSIEDLLKDQFDLLSKSVYLIIFSNDNKMRKHLKHPLPSTFQPEDLIVSVIIYKFEMNSERSKS